MKYFKVDTNRTPDEMQQIFSSRISDAKIVFDKFGEKFYHRNCPICGNNSFTNLNKFIDRYSICLCDWCNSSYVNPVPSQEALMYYYNECQSNQLYTMLNKRREQKKDIRLDDRVKFLKIYIQKLLLKKNKINILEVGCNNGGFLSKAKEYLILENLDKKVKLYGIDLDEGAIKNPIDKTIHLKALAAEQMHRLGVSFDLIICFELIEHLADPGVFVKSVYNNLSPNGFFIFTTPNASGLDNKALSYNKQTVLAHSICPPLHLNAFSTQNIALFAYKNGFKLSYVDTPGRLDMDTISILTNQLDDKNLQTIVKYDEDIKAHFQYLISYLNASGHLRAVFSRADIMGGGETSSSL